MADRMGVRPIALLAASLALAGCMNFSSLDDLDSAPPPSDQFSLALYKNYTFLAQSFGSVGQASYSAFDQEGSIPLTETELTTAALANTFAHKAVVLTKGQVVDPEPSRDIHTHELRDRLIRALDPGKEAFPRDAARAQADWDCWRLNERTPGQAASAEQCHRSFETTLPRLEAETAALVKAAEAAKAAQKKPSENGDTSQGAGQSDSTGMSETP